MANPKKKIDHEGYKSHLDYQSKLDKKIIVFDNYQFTESIIVIIGSKITFSDCIFDEDVKVNYVAEEIIFKKCEFKKLFNSSNSIYIKNVKFWESTFNKVDFNNAKFNSLADFWSCTFNHKTIFYKTDFMGTTVFSAATFKKAVLFTYTSISKVIIFRGTNFEKGLDLSQAIISGNVSLHDIRINKFKAVDNTKINGVYESYITEEGKIPFTNKRETFRIIKQTFSKNGNEIDSLEYRKKEFETFFKEIISNLKIIIFPETINHLKGKKYLIAYFKKLISLKIRIFYKLYKLLINIQNLIILFLNYISNLFGFSWLRAFLFVAIVGGFFYLKSIIQLPGYHFTYHYNEWQWEHFKYFFEFLNPTHKIDYIQKENLNNWFYFYDFAGRIFVGYGIYQFIQAFRKYK